MIDPALYLDNLEYIPAANMKPRTTTPDLIVLHSIESPQRVGAARSSAQWHATGNTIGSAHIHVDGGPAIIRGVPDDYRANGAAGANERGLHLEQAGRAAQTAAEWDNDFSRAMLDQAAHVVASWCIRYDIPAVLLGPADLRAGKPGVVTHAAVSEAFGLSDHWDPGPNYPADKLLARVQELIGDEVDYLKMAKLFDERIAKACEPGGPIYKACGLATKRQLRTQLVPKVLKQPVKSLGEKIAGVFKKPAP